jgi:hypothetical protein
VLWLVIPMVALLLGGVVWVKAAELHLVTRTSSVVERYQAVQADTLRLKAQLEQRDGEVIRRAERELGMVPIPANGVTYLRVPRTSTP